MPQQKSFERCFLLQIFQAGEIGDVSHGLSHAPILQSGQDGSSPHHEQKLRSFHAASASKLKIFHISPLAHTTFTGKTIGSWTCNVNPCSVTGMLFCVQCPLSELVRLLMFESEHEAQRFCEHYGFYCEDARVFLERSAFITPESNLAPTRAVQLVESKQKVRSGEVRLQSLVDGISAKLLAFRQSSRFGFRDLFCLIPAGKSGGECDRQQACYLCFVFRL